VQGNSGHGPDRLSGGWKNAQSDGISEQYNFSTPVFANERQRGPQADYAYTMNAGQDGWWTGAWGLMRSYSRIQPNLHVLPNNDPSQRRRIRNGRDFDAVCPRSAPERGPVEPDAAERWRETARRIAAAIERGETEHACGLAQALHDEALARHDRGMSRVTGLLSWIGRRHGTDALEQAYGEAMSADLLGDASFRGRAEALMHFTRVHLQPFALTEDDEKLTFLCSVCPSGGRLLREGHYEPPRGGLHVAGPGPLTWGRSELPVYCCHEPVMEKASIEATGVPLFVVEPSEHLGEEPCRTYLYKDPADIPERFYTRLGLSKPSSGKGSRRN